VDPVILFIAIISSYLIGSISFGKIFMRIFKPEETLDDLEIKLDDRPEGYKLMSVGGNTVSMKLGAKGGCAVGLLDILKSFVPPLVFRILYPDQPYFIIAALAAFIGHNWPIYYRFKGGRGISSFYGGMFAIDPLGAVVVASASMILGLFILKQVIVAFMGGVFLVIFWFLVTKFTDPLFWYYMGYAVLVNILFITAMLPEIRQDREMTKKYGRVDPSMALETFPMGKHMLRLMKLLKLDKKTIQINKNDTLKNDVKPAPESSKE